MLISEISSPSTHKKAKPRKSLKPLKPLKRVKPLKPLKPISPLNPADAMIADKKRRVEVAKMALKQEKEFQRRRKELEKQRTARNPSSR